MREIIIIESKRILKAGMLLIFFFIVILLAANSSFRAVKSYELWDENGFVASGKENLNHGKENAGKIGIEEAIALRGTAKEKAVFVNETNIEKLVSLNYSGKTAKELSNAEINLFYENRLKTIKQMMDESSRISYTEREKERLLEKAGELVEFKLGFSEGWKVLNQDTGSFISFALIMIAILLMPLFANDAQTRMNELSRSTKKGKKTLDMSRIIAAFGIGSLLYLMAMAIFFLIKMLPFGLAGSGEYIQSSTNTFYSVFHITYLEQFIGNCIRGYAALIFVVSLTILITVILERIMVGIVVTCFYWILLLVMEQMQQFEVNHFFANFMPLRLAGSMDFYITNEIYRFAEKSIDSIVWCPAVTIILSIIIIVVSVIWLYVKSSGNGRKRILIRENEDEGN